MDEGLISFLAFSGWMTALMLGSFALLYRGLALRRDIIGSSAIFRRLSVARISKKPCGTRNKRP